MTLPGLPALIVEIGFASNTGDYLILDSTSSGILNTNVLAAGTGIVPVWTDVSNYVIGFSTNTGRQRPLGTFTAGTASFTFRNTDGRFSPTNTTGPYASGGVTQVRPGIAVRLQAIWAGVTYPLWYGYIESWTDEMPAAAPKAMFATADCSDGFARLARFEGLAQSPQGDGERGGARCRRILDNAGWDTGLSDLDDGQTLLQDTTLEGNALAELQLVADSENGEIYMAPDGRFTFDQRYIRITDTTSNTSQATFGSTGVDLKYHALTPAYDTDLVINRAQYTRTGGTTQTVNDVVSQADNGIVTDTKDNLFNQADSDVLAAAGWVVGRFRNPERRIDGIEILPRRAPATLWPATLSRRIRDRITVKLTPAAGTAITQDTFIEGVSHDYQASSGQWSTKLRLSSASAYLPFFILDSSTQGVLNSNVLAY